MADQQFTNYIGKYTLTLSPEYCIEDSLIQNGVWEAEVSRCISYLVESGQHCVDVGANCGLITIAMADKVGSTGSVHAFEPSSVSYPRLERNITQNADLIHRVRLYRCGLAEHRGTLKLFETGDKPGNAYLAENQKKEYWNRYGENEFESCPVETLDSVFDEQRVDFIKIDVEGMEYEVLLGGINTIKRDRPIIVFETLLRCFDNTKIAQCDKLLTSLGYLLFIIHPIDGQLVPTHFPNFAEDTLAIHRSKIDKYRHLMFKEELLDQALAAYAT